jgi:hypothetical protein
MTETQRKLKQIADKYTTPFLYNNMVAKVQLVTVSSEEINLNNIVVFASLNIQQKQNVQVTQKVLNDSATDIGATGYTEMAPKVAAEIYDVMIGDGYTSVKGDKTQYVAHYVKTYAELVAKGSQQINISLVNLNSLTIDLKRVLIDPCGMSRYYTADEMKDLYDGDPNRKFDLIANKTKKVAADHFTRDQECGINDKGKVIWPTARITQSVDVNTVIEIVSKVYTDAFNMTDFKKSEPEGTEPPPTPPPPADPFPKWAQILVIVIACILVVGGLIYFVSR